MTNTRLPQTLYPSEFRTYFSDIHYDTLMRQYQRDTQPEEAYALNGKCYEVSSHYNRWGDRVIKLKVVKPAR